MMTDNPKDDPRYISSDRVTKLAFLFRRGIASRLRKTRHSIDLLAPTISGALRGDDENNPTTRWCIDQLIMLFHPDGEQRRAAAQRTLDDLEFGFESDIKKLEFSGELEAAKRMRKQIYETRVDMEKRFGKLKRAGTVVSLTKRG